MKKLNLPKGCTIAIDTETTGLDWWREDRPYIISWCSSSGASGCLRWKVDIITREVAVDEVELKQLRTWFSTKRRWIFHNAKFDIEMLHSIGLPTPVGRIEDTMILAHSWRNNQPKGLKWLGVNYLDYPDNDEKILKDEVKRLRKKYKKTKGFTPAAAVPADYFLAGSEVETYAIADAERTMLLWVMLRQAIKHDSCVKTTYRREIELLQVVLSMERKGVRIDLSKLREEIKKGKKLIQEYYKELKKYRITPAILRSTQQLAEVLFIDLGLPSKDIKRSEKTGQLSVSHFELEKLFAISPVAMLIVQTRAIIKLTKDFFERYLKLAVKNSKGEYELHPTFNQVGTRTGRFSSSNPNMQNVAADFSGRSPVPIQARTPFGPRKDYVWYHLDYSQLEVRVFASIAKDKNMLDAFAHGVDFHSQCANKAWGGYNNPAAIEEMISVLALDRPSTMNEDVNVLWEKRGWTPLKKGDTLNRKWRKRASQFAYDFLEEFDWDVVKAQKSFGLKKCRSRAKLILFCRIYGGGAAAVQEMLRVSLSDSKKFMEQYVEAFPRIASYTQEIIAEVRRNGFIVNAYNRKLYVDRDKAYRGVNYMIQSSCADLLKIAMIKVHKFLRQNKLDAYMVATIHDEIVIEINTKKYTKRKINWILKVIKLLMEDDEGKFDLPMIVEIEHATNNWAKKEIYNL